MSKPDLKPVEERVAPSPAPEELKALLQAERQAREKRAVEQINQILEKERCSMNPTMVFTAQGHQARVEITALD